MLLRRLTRRGAHNLPEVPVSNPSDTAQALVERFENALDDFHNLDAELSVSAHDKVIAEVNAAKAALLAHMAGVEAEFPSDVPDVPRAIWEALNEVDPDWAGGMIEGNVRDSQHAAAAIRQLRPPRAAVIGQCKTCRFAITESDGKMECGRMSRVQSSGSPLNGTAYATPYEGCSAVLEVSPDFGCVMWSAHKELV